MRRGLVLVMLALAVSAVAEAQQPMAARANVTAYYDDAAVEKLAYRESPYYQELAGSWQPSLTDSSIRYTQTLEVEKEWRDFKVYLNVRCGRAVRVLLNDKELGYKDDSRHWNEFLLDPALRYGRPNTLTIEAMRQSRGALLEDATLQVGLNGTPYLLFKNDPNVSDFSLVADYDAASATGSLTVLADVFCGKRKGKYYLEVEVWDSKGHVLDKMGRWVVFNGRSEELVEVNRTWSDVTPWNAEAPVLYTAVVRLRDEKMEEEETVGARFGFRRVEVKDGQLLLNGKAVTIKGVTYGLERSDGVAAREKMKQDVFTMKRLNINAVRTARFSPIDPYFYELCDQYGLYVVCDANLLPLSEQRLAVATDRDYLPLFEERVENLYGKYKNHTSIIAWSLGNTRDNGVCMTAAYKRLKAIEKMRPVIFSGADYGESTDLIAPMYPEANTLAQALTKQGGGRPSILLAAVDAAHFADLKPLWQVVRNQRQLQGAFLDAWPLNTTMQQELKHLFRPFDVSVSKLSPDEGEFVVSNLNDFTTFGQYTLEYNIYTNLRPNITGGELPVAVAVGGMDKVGMLIPGIDLGAGEDLYISFDLATRRNARKVWQRNEDLERGVVQLALPHTKRALRMLSDQGSQAPDSVELPNQLYFVGHEDWTSTLVDRQVRRPDATTLCVDKVFRYTTPEGRQMCDVYSTYTAFGTGDIVVDYTVVVTARIRGAGLQPAIKVQHQGDSITWYGLDREVCFETEHSGLLGIYSQPVSAFSRREVRWCAHRGGDALFLEMLGSSCTVKADGSSISLVPQETKNMRLHMRPYTQGAPVEYTGVDFPHMAPEIQITPQVTHRSSFGHVEKTTFSRKPNTPYNVGADTLLFDGETGDVEDLSRNWLGFSGSDLRVDVQLASAAPVETVTLRFAHNPAVWAFAPRSMRVSVSSDGITYGPVQSVTPMFEPADQTNAVPQTVTLEVPMEAQQAQYLRIEIAPIPQLPDWHRGKGLKPWLMMDELVVTTAEE